jgi:hypothetical protein
LGSGILWEMNGGKLVGCLDGDRSSLISKKSLI